jgi:uncharacterized protein YukE
MKKVLLLCLLFFGLHAYALELVAPENVPEGSSFAVLAEISETNFGEIKVFIDNTVVFTQSLSASPNFKYIASYIPYDPSSHKTLVLVFHPLGAGEYTIKVKLLRDSETVNEEEVSISVFTPVQSSSIESLSHDVEIVREELKIVKGKNNTLSEELNSLKKTLSELKSKVSSFEASFEEVKSGLSENSSAYEALQASLNKLKESLNTTSATLSEINKETNTRYEDMNAALSSLFSRLAQVEEHQSKVTTGFITLGQSVAVASIAIIIIIVVALVLKKKRSMHESLFESGSEESTTYSDDSSAIIDDILASQSEESHRGRWAYKGEAAEAKPKEERRFSLGDLIKRN